MQGIGYRQIKLIKIVRKYILNLEKKGINTAVSSASYMQTFGESLGYVKLKKFNNNSNFSEFTSYISNKYWNYNVEDNAFILMRNKNGVVASLHSTATQWQHKFSMEITFQRGFIDLKGILSGTKSYGKESITMISKKDVEKNKEGKKLFFSKDSSWKDEVNEFAKLIFYKKKKYFGNIYDAENVMFTLDRIYRSDKKWYKYLKKSEV